MLEDNSDQNDTLQVYHVTWSTHGSKVSERMILYNVPRIEGLFLNASDEIEILKYLVEIIKKNKYKVLALNILPNHVHLILVCKEQERDNIVKELKCQSTSKYKANHKINDKFSLWAQKYGRGIKATEKSLNNAINYVKYNREKHGLVANMEMERIISTVLIDEVDLGV